MKNYFLLILFGVFSVSLSWGQVTVSGRVTDASGQGLQGATVLVKGTTVGMLTNENGEYILDIPATGEIIVFSYVGMKAQDIAINGRETINVQLELDDVSLEEVVVMGYTRTSKQKVISSVAVVGAEKIENVPLPDVNQLIQGQAAGVLSTGGSGQPGSSQSVRIRGTGSINAGRGPLYVIDGVIIETGDFVATGSSDILANLNANDIESVNILKDATAISLYGARGANGVIVINTKRGIEGKTQIQARIQGGFSEANLNGFEMMNAQEFLQYERELMQAAGFSQGEIDLQRPLSLANVDTDWLDLAFNRGQQQMYEFSARGGSKSTRFFVSGNYFLQEGTIALSGFERYSVRTNVDHKAGEKFDISMDVNLSYTDQTNAFSGNSFLSPISGALSNAPWTRYKDPLTGELLVGRTPNDNIEALNFESFLRDNFVRTNQLNTNYSRNFRTLGNITAGYQILDNLRIQQKIAADLINVNEKQQLHPETPDGFRFNGLVSDVFTPSITYTLQTLLTGNFTLGESHNFDGVGGFEFQQNDTERFLAQGQGFADGRLLNLNSSSLPVGVGGSGTSYSFLSYFAQANYNFQNTYYLTASIRRDASSRFGENNRWGTFYSVGGSWRLTEAAFLKNFEALSSLKLRASFGTSGNAEIGNFQSLATYSFGSSYDGQPGSAPTQVPNPDLTWENNESSNIGLDFGFFNERLTGTAEVYRRTSRDMLLNRPLSATSGFTSVLRNLGDMKNEGIELTVNAKPFAGRRFNWDIDFNISFNRNEILSLADTTEIPNGIQVWRVGEPIRSWFLPQWAGVNPADGTPLWADGEGGVTGTWEDAPDQIVGNAEPDFIVGLTNTLTFNRLSLSFFFYAVQGHEVYDVTRFFIDSDGANFGENRPVYAADRWRQPGDVAERPQALVGGNNNGNNNSTRYLFDGSYIRLRNVVLGYVLPTSWTKTLSLSNIRVYAQGQNVLTITDYPGWDPELAEAGTEFFRYPSSRSYTFGIDVGF
ncbi:MAG: TonB-dependent receptor [Bacteroidota bacterium]